MKELTSVEKYFNKFKLYDQSGVGVMLTKTREPLRLVEECIMRFSTDGRPFGLWDMTRGLSIYTTENSEYMSEEISARDIDVSADLHLPIATDVEKIDLLRLFSEISDFTHSGRVNEIQKKPDNFITILLFPHWNIKRIAGVIQNLLNLNWEYTYGKRRIILITPEDFEMPSELAEIKTIDFDTPSTKELEDIVEAQLAPSKADKIFTAPEVIERKTDIAKQGKGLTRYDFEAAVANSLANTRKKPRFDDVLKEIQDIKTESLKATNILSLEKPEKMENVAGLDVLKEWIIKRKPCFTEEAKKFGIEPLKGIFLAGAMGTGKSLFAKAIADTLGMPLIRFDVSNVFDKFVGSSEQRMKDTLKLIEQQSPCVAGDTLILTERGEVKVEELYACNVKNITIPTLCEKTEEKVSTVMKRIIKRKRRKKLLTIIDETDKFIKVTYNHKLLVERKEKLKWVKAKNLRNTDLLVRYE